MRLEIKSFDWISLFHKLQFCSTITLKYSRSKFLMQIPSITYFKETKKVDKNIAEVKTKTIPTDLPSMIMTIDFSRYLDLKSIEKEKAENDEDEFVEPNCVTYRYSQFADVAHHMNKTPIIFDFDKDQLIIKRRNLSSTFVSNTFQLKRYFEQDPWRQMKFDDWRWTINCNLLRDILSRSCFIAGLSHKIQRLESISENNLVLSSSSLTSAICVHEIQLHKYLNLVKKTDQTPCVEFLPYYSRHTLDFLNGSTVDISVSDQGLSYHIDCPIPTKIDIQSIRNQDADYYRAF